MAKRVSYPLSKMQFSRPVEPQDGVKVPGGAVEVVFAAGVGKIVAQLTDSCGEKKSRLGEF